MFEGVPEGAPSTDGMTGARQGEVLKGNNMVFAEGEETMVLYKELLKKKKAIKTKFTLNSEASKTSLAENGARLGSHYYSDMIRANIHLAVEDAISWQTQFNQTFTEMLTMIDGVECEEDGAQERERQRFYAEVKSEWDKEVKKLMAYRDYRTSVEGQLAHPGGQKWGGRQEHKETVARWRNRKDLDPGTIPEDISKLEWRL